jgi:hypothetical protein
MPMPAAKNFSLSSAASDLGLGDQVRQQLQDEEEERKKKMSAAAGRGLNPLGPATQSLFAMQGGA